MALFSFGKKDKNPPEAAVPVAKAPPTPPKIQTPPASATIPAVKPPQPSGLIPASGLPAGTATTQPMVMPRGAAGLKPSRPGVAQSSRSTQRIVLPSGTPGARPTTTTRPLSMAAPAGRINLPIGMILRCLPPEVLASDLAEFEASGAAATEIGLPMNMILSQLPSGKVEMPLQDLVPHFPAGYLQPTESIASYLPNLINLPLMDVVMRIPPDLLALRPDQKGVDAAVINMADPFTEEILREQAEAARRQSQANIIEESQVPQAEEFIPQAPAPKTIAPPPRPPSAALPMPRPSTTTGAMPQTSKLPPPPIPGAVTPTPSAPSLSARTISPSGQPLAPTRATSPVPIRPSASAATTIPIQVPPPTPAPPSAPVPRHTTSLPVPPVPRQTGLVPPVTRQHTASLQMPPRPSSTLPLPMMPTVPIPIVPSAPVASAPPAVEPPSAPLPVGAPDPGADDLQRLAALAMAQMGENSEQSQVTAATQEVPPPAAPEPEPVASVPVPEVPAPVEASEPEPVSTPPPPPEEEPKPVSIPLPLAEEKVATVPLPSVAPVAESVPPAPEPEPEPEPAPKPAFKFIPPPPAPAPIVEAAPVASSGGVFNLNTCTLDELMQIPGCFRDLAESIVQHREKIGSFKRLEDLLDVPGMTKAAYTNLTGETPPDNRIPLSLNELLGFPGEQHLSLKDVTDRIACWPDVTGCILSQSTGLSLVGNVPAGLDKAAIVAFAPRMFEAINKSFAEIAGKETDELTIPTSGTSFHIFRNKDLYLIILSRLPQMPERHMKVARFVLAALSIRRD